MAKTKVSKKTALELFKIDSLRYTIVLPLYLIFLVLLWHWNYLVAFWIFLVLIIIEFIGVIYKMNKKRKNLFK